MRKRIRKIQAACGRFAVGLSLAGALAACGGGGGGGDSGTGPEVPPNEAPPPSVYDLNVDPHPLAATISLDTARAVSADFPVEGGTLTATDADGVRYTLTVPANALTLPVRITMTPLASVKGLPFGERSYGVQLGPDGQQFLNFVTLSVKPPTGMSWPLDQQIPVTLDGAKNQLSLAALDTALETPTFKLLHFSSYVVLLSEKGFDASVSDVRKRIGGSEERRLNSAAAEVLANERQRQMRGEPPSDVWSELAPLRKEFIDTVLKPRIAAAGSSCAAGKLAMQTLLGQERQDQLLGHEESDLDAMGQFGGALGDSVTEVCMREEYEICRDEHIVTRIAGKLFGVLRQDALLGIINPKREAMASEYARKCLQFEVQFDSDMTLSVNTPAHTVRETMSSRLKLGFVTDTMQLPPNTPPEILQSYALISASGLVPLVSKSYAASYTEPCYENSAPHGIGGLFGAAFLGIEPDVDAPGNPGGSNRVKDFKLSLALDASSAGVSNHTVSHRNYNATTGGCEDKPQSYVEYEGWLSAFGGQWLSEITVSDSGAVVRSWASAGNNDIMATKDVSRSFDDGQSHASGTVRMVLFHTPIR